ncbi:hypothetical protein IWZ00DRAFT_519864 [Phyllosticta capitalensis]
MAASMCRLVFRCCVWCMVYLCVWQPLASSSECIQSTYMYIHVRPTYSCAPARALHGRQVTPPPSRSITDDSLLECLPLSLVTSVRELSGRAGVWGWVDSRRTGQHTTIRR